MSKNTLPGTIRGKILLSTAIVTATIAIITVSVCFLVFQSFLRKNQLRSAEYNLQVASNNISAYMENILYFEQWCCTNTDIGRYLEAFKDQEGMPPISSGKASLRITASNTYERLKEEYYNTYASKHITRVVISPVNGQNYLQISDTVSSNTSAAARQLQQSDRFLALLEAPTLQWDGLMEDPLSPGTDPIIPIVRPIYSLYGPQMTGWCYLAVSPRVFLDYMEALPLEEDASLYLHIGGHSYRFLDDTLTEVPFDYPILSDISRQTFNPESRAYQIRWEDGQKRILLTCPLWGSWTLSLVLSQQAYDQQSSLYLWIIAGTVLTILLLGHILYRSLDRMIGRPVGLLLEKIAAISKGDFSPAPAIEWRDEFGRIGRGINQMAENVSTLMEKRVADEKQKKDLEYQILQSQINPHFLYNTLNSIKWMATIQNADGIAEMITALARLMKNASKGTSAMIPLKDELDLTMDYFLIQQYRYGGSISLEQQIASDELYGCLVHRFTLQPIIENAMFHGIEPKGCIGKILVAVWASEEGAPDRRLFISVRDNGVGMSPEQIQQVLKGADPSANDLFRHVGISNVDRRIKYDFGEGYGITIESLVGEYTTMLITLPYCKSPAAG